MILGILGNLATVVVILSNKYMRSPTNIYLTNLAIADIFTLSLSKRRVYCNLYFLFQVNFFSSFSRVILRFIKTTNNTDSAFSNKGLS